MKPSELRPGDIVKMEGIKHELKFVRREPLSGSYGARNIFICKAWAGKEGFGEEGYCPISNYGVSLKCTLLRSSEVDYIRPSDILKKQIENANRNIIHTNSSSSITSFFISSRFPASTPDFFKFS